MDINFNPGINKEETSYSVGQGFIDSNLIRWRGANAAIINGWYQRTISQNLSGICRSIHEFSTLTGTDLVAFGTSSKLYVLSGDQIYDITPQGFVPGPASASVATGWGIGTWGTPGASGGGWGLPRVSNSDPFAQVVQQPLIWSLDNFGEDLVAAPYADVGNPGPIYIWDPSAGFGNPAKALISNSLSDGGVPSLCRGVFVSPQTQVLIAVGCCPYGSNYPDPMQIRWCDLEDFYTWIPAAGNSAGGYRLPSGSYIVGWLNMYYETLFFTDTTVYSMQLVPNYVFGFNPVGQGMSLISPKAAYSNGSLTMWMDNGSFYQYSGSVTELPCPLKSFLFGNGSGSLEQTGDLDRSQAFKIYSAGNHSYSEVSWFYPSVNGNGEVDSYVKYNYATGLWDNGTLARTAWSDSGHLENPIAVDPSGNVYMHEYGTDQQLISGNVALPWSLTTGDICIQGGDVYTLLQRIIPDFVWQGVGGKYQEIMCDVRVKESSNSTPRVVKTFTITPNDNNRGYFDMKVRGRRVSFRFYASSNPGTAWTLGKLQAVAQPNGTR